MAEVKWIKIVTDVFDDEKILLIESLPEADSLIVIWFKLLCLAGKQNNSGVFVMNGRIPYTDEMFATIFRRNINTIRLALSTFDNFGMIERINDAVTIPNWSKHQNFDQIEKKNEYQKQYMREYRAKQKQLASAENDKLRKPNGETNSNTNGEDYSNAHVRPLDKIREEEIREEENREDILPGAEASAPEPEPEPTVIIALPLVDKTEYVITDKQVNNWHELYPAVDVLQELRKMRGWLEANSKRGKTRNGILRFITGWLAKEQDKGGVYRNKSGSNNNDTNNPFLKMAMEGVFDDE
ncbi:phage replisome organizer N-terminal domain-containing protein [Acetobacterium wieringae]|uniref:Phage replisome organizer N-terminal domain-containing protein n=1 Tax=Acetobacterium wieringae TaxID=52694 RepID=A0ABY6HBX5_9FIRM|nr:phage replisome organizer N-terminal domain-containing protein [Acetobacterium wieringae]UYO61845.1 phage replisome organizer N-terminal domain-containing protein [Acetobacterium wieringae]